MNKEEAKKRIEKSKKNILMIIFSISGMFSINIISEKAPPAADASKKRIGLNSQPVTAAVALSSR